MDYNFRRNFLIVFENDKMFLFVYLKYKRGGFIGGKKRGVYFVCKNWMCKINFKNWFRVDVIFKK